MTTVNIVEAFRVLSSVQSLSHNEQHFYNVIQTVLMPKNPTEDLLSLIRSIDHELLVERYWIAMFEAYMIANQTNAHNIAIYAHKVMADHRTVFCYPYMIVGFLRAANWITNHPSEGDSGEFEKVFPTQIGKILVRFSKDSSHYRLPHTTDVSLHLLGVFSFALSEYLSAKDVHVRWNRISLFSRALRHIDTAGPYASKFMAEVNSRLLHKLDLCHQIRMLSKFYEEDAGAKASVYAGK